MKSNRIQRTADGSQTLYSGRFSEHYHSVHGALSESRHVFIQSGLEHFYRSNGICDDGIDVLEVGFGSGLNALLSLQWAMDKKIRIRYTAVEPYPITMVECGQLEYAKSIGAPEMEEAFQQMHASFHAVVNTIATSPLFTFSAKPVKLDQISASGKYDVLFFDAFSPEKQSEMWTTDVFSRLFEVMKPGGVLTTYCAKGAVRRGLQQAGFQMERLPGPAFKREILRATHPFQLSQGGPN